MDAIVYVRWSTKDQKKGDSEKRQMELAAQACKEHNWTLTETLIEHGKSAYHGKNRAAGGKLRSIEERAARGELAGKVLIVEAMDRLSRQKPLESVNLLSTLAKQGLTIYESGSRITYDAAKIDEHWTNLIIVFAKAGEAYESSAEKARRVKSAWRGFQERLTTKDGRANPNIAPAWIDVVDGEYVVNEARAQVVRSLFENVSNGIGLRPATKRANESRLTLGWPKHEWSAANVSRLLHSRNAVGEYLPQTFDETGKRVPAGDWVPAYPAIITKELWHRTQEALASRNKTGGPRSKNVNVLSPFTYCGAHNGTERCGSRMTHRVQKQGPTTLVCSRYHRGGGCKSNTNYRYTDLLKGVLDHVLPLAMPSPASETGKTQRVTVAKAELAAKQARLEEMADKLIEKDDPVLERAYERFKARVEEEANEVARLIEQSERSAAKLPFADLAGRIAELRGQLDTCGDARLKVQSYLSQMIDAIFLDPSDRSATVVLIGGLHVLKLDARGNLISTVSAMNLLDVPTEVLGQANGDAFIHDMRKVAAGGSPVRELALEQLIQRTKPE